MGQGACQGRPRSQGARGLVLGDDGGRDAATGGEGAGDAHAPRRAGGHQVVEDLVGGRFVEDAAVAVGQQVVLQGLQLDTAVASGT